MLPSIWRQPPGILSRDPEDPPETPRLGPSDTQHDIAALRSLSESEEERQRKPVYSLSESEEEEKRERTPRARLVRQNSIDRESLESPGCSGSGELPGDQLRPGTGNSEDIGS